MDLIKNLEQTAMTKGENVALIFEGNKWTYRELMTSIERFADGLVSEGFQAGDHIALILGNSPHFVISFFGALKAGLVVVPVNPTYTPSEIGYMLVTGDVKGIVAPDQLLPIYEQVYEQLPAIERVIICAQNESACRSSLKEVSDRLVFFGKLVSGDAPEAEHPSIQPDDTAVILFTSGTTGKPKGAMLTHVNLYSNARDIAEYLSIDEKDKVIAALPMFHVFCLTVCMNAPLMHGATIYVLPHFSPSELLRMMEKEKPTLFVGVPTMYNYLYRQDGHEEAMKSVRICISGGASMPVALLHGFEEKFGVTVLEGYGLSEASPVTAFNPLDGKRKPGSVGTDIMNVKNKIVNELGEEVGPNEVGELIAKGPNIMKGYYQMPEDTEAALKDGWLYTGDLARRDEDGYIYIVDRKKDMILVGGYNVYPREVEEVLYQHEAVAEAVVIGVPDPNTGEAVVCYISPKKHAHINQEDIITHCLRYLAKYKQPQTIHFIDDIPKNTTGKILRRALKDKYQAETSK